MLVKSLAVFLVAQLAAAQTPTTSAPTTSSTSLPDLVAQIDPCVLDCIQNVSGDIGCSSASDFECLCSTNIQNFRQKVTNCMIGKILECDASEAARSGELIGPICDTFKAEPNSPEVASASQIVDSGTSSTGTPNSDNNNNNNDNGDSAATGVVANSLLALIVALAVV